MSNLGNNWLLWREGHDALVVAWAISVSSMNTSVELKYLFFKARWIFATLAHCSNKLNLCSCWFVAKALPNQETLLLCRAAGLARWQLCPQGAVTATTKRGGTCSASQSPKCFGRKREQEGYLAPSPCSCRITSSHLVSGLIGKVWAWGLHLFPGGSCCTGQAVRTLSEDKISVWNDGKWGTTEKNPWCFTSSGYSAILTIFISGLKKVEVLAVLKEPWNL